MMLLVVACAGRTAAWEQKKTQDGTAATVGADEAGELDKKAETVFNERLALEKAEAAALAYSDAASKAPSADRLAKLSRAYYFLADTHYNLANRKDDMQKTYKKGLEAGEQALVLAAPDFAKMMREGAKVEAAVKVIPKEAVPSIYWYAVNLGKWARLEGMAVILYHKDKIKAYMERAHELDAGYFHAAPPRYFGGMFAVAPAFAGGDLKKSEESFLKSLEMAPNYLATKVLMAELLMTKKQDRATFEKLLKEVIAADEKLIEDVVPENTMEKKKAEALLAKVEDLF
jgi:tetratricopeptide (TPR) repeat protein